MNNAELKELAAAWSRAHPSGELCKNKKALADAYLAASAKLDLFMALVPLLDYWSDEVCQASTMSQNDSELLEAWVAFQDDMKAQGKRGPS